MHEGTIISLQTEKGFGFIKPKGQGPDVFFHHKSFAGRLDSLTKGQAVWYELDDDSARPRARFLNTSSRVPRGMAAQRPRRPSKPSYKGHITNLKRTTREGFISPTTGGTEVVFRGHVVVDRGYKGLELGQYVEYTLSSAVDEKHRAIADHVAPTERHVTDSVPKLGRHPNARRKKPSWRG